MLMAAAIYVPFLQAVLKTVALPPIWILGVLLIGATNVAAMEFGKWLFPKLQSRRSKK